VTRKLPTWEQAEAAVNDQAASPLEIFIHEFEPIGDDADRFRTNLAEVLNDSKVFLQTFVTAWSPDDSVCLRDFQERLSAVVDWLKAFVSGCPDVAWEA
jgi:hypothetical protein